MSIQQPPVQPASLVKTEFLTVIKNEPPEPEFGIDDIHNSPDGDFIQDIKHIDIVEHILSEDSIKTESVPENILEIKHKTEDNGQEVLEVQASNEEFDALSNPETNEQLVLNISKDLNSINMKSKKPEHPEKTLWEENKEKVKVIEAPVIQVGSHEYTSLAKQEHVCNYCRHVFNSLQYVKHHITKMHRKVTTMFQCPYCPFKSKWKSNLRLHIIQKDKDTKDIQWFQCHLCDMKFKIKCQLARHTLVHSTHKPKQDGLNFCPICGKGFSTKSKARVHEKFVHNKKSVKLKKCEMCEYTTFKKNRLDHHIKTHHTETYECSECDYKTKHKNMFERHKRTYENEGHKKKHENRILGGMKFQSPPPPAAFAKFNIRYRCDKCSYKNKKRTNLKRHQLIHLKPEEIQYFYCYHCSYKSRLKANLKTHIFRHFKREEVAFHCYMCDFMTLKREFIIEHIKKHSKIPEIPTPEFLNLCIFSLY